MLNHPAGSGWQPPWSNILSAALTFRYSAFPTVLTKRIIPCLDVDKGRVVKGVKFFDHVDAGDPVEQARRYENDGADELVFYDITAALKAARSWPIWWPRWSNRYSCR